MGEMVEFQSNGTTANGYLAVPASGSGPGVIVIQEWWGLVPHIINVCDRFAADGFTALAPDLYHGETTTEPDEAGKLMMALNLPQASKDISGAVDYLLAGDKVSSETLGITGFCMGGGLALAAACDRPDAIKACVPFYGIIPWPDYEPDYEKLEAKVYGHFAAEDAFFGPDLCQSLETRLQAMGKDVELFVHPGVEHAFFNDTRAEVYHRQTAEKAWTHMIAFFRDNIT